jgi:hypothetical protein
MGKALSMAKFFLLMVSELAEMLARHAKSSF